MQLHILIPQDTNKSNNETLTPSKQLYKGRLILTNFKITMDFKGGIIHEIPLSNKANILGVINILLNTF